MDKQIQGLKVRIDEQNKALVDLKSFIREKMHEVAVSNDEITSIVKELHRTQKEPQTSEKKYLDSPEAAKYLNCSTRILYDWRKQGIIEAIQVGRKILYSQESLDRFLNEHLVNRKGGDQ